MKEKIFEELQNANDYGFNNPSADFEDEADMNNFLTWATAFNDEHKTVNIIGGASIGMPL